MLLRFLSRSGYEVAGAPDGRAALHAALERKPDLILLDLLMPTMDGPELIDVLRSYLRFSALPIVVADRRPRRPRSRARQTQTRQRDPRQSPGVACRHRSRHQ